jgi:hypothetical protein
MTRAQKNKLVAKFGNALGAWKTACKEDRGVVLVGDKSHWCPDIKHKPVDETCKDFCKCRCYDVLPEDVEELDA